LESWESRFLSNLDSAKESLEGSMQLLERVLQDVNVGMLILRKFCTHLRKFSHLCKLIRTVHPTLFEGTVVEMATEVERLLQRSGLLAGSKQPIFESLYHTFF
jgi:hypothetical protein